MKLSKQLENMCACPEAVKWIGKRGAMTAWRDCNRTDWMLWAANKFGIDQKLLVLCACDIAETVLHLVPEGENRPAKAIQTTRNWCNGTATRQECRDAAAAADAASYAAYAAANAYAAAASAAKKDQHKKKIKIIKKYLKRSN